MTGLDQRSDAVTLPRGPLAGFATGSLGMGVWVTVPGLLLLYFLTDVLAVAPWLAGLTLLLPKIADVLLHPWIGHRCDVEQARRGHRRRLLLAGCALPLAFAALFAVPGGLTGTPRRAGWRCSSSSATCCSPRTRCPTWRPRRTCGSATTSGPG
ncbi:MFS transporter [Micromonospora sp. BRA006-A]|nr:MFS transporter [Micromonospora sp. BRA006-A]